MQVNLKATICDLPNGLDSNILDTEHNFSAGQRSQISLARAILRNNTILVLDEATANLDHSTENLMLSTIRKQFARCTVLTIAHRLNTIMNSDKVLVMDAGSAVEFDHAHRLLQNSDGFLTKLVNETPDPQYLREIAQNSFEKRFKVTDQ